MSQWAQQPGFQYPLQTGFPTSNTQFQHPQFQQQVPQFQQAPSQFQQGYGLGAPSLVSQPTGLPGQRLQGFQPPPQTGLQTGSALLQAQPTGFIGGSFQQQVRHVPPVPSLPVQLPPPNPNFSFLNAPPQQPNRFLTPSPALTTSLAPQPTGFAGRASAPLIPQVTGFVDPRLQLMSSTFMPMNTSAPYSVGGVPLLAPQQQDLQQSFQQHNQTQRGTTNQHVSWALTKAEKKNYDNIFRSWDAQGTGFISGQTALEVFGASGLPKEDLARIWALADIDNRGKLDVAEFHVAMGLIYRRLNGMPIPDQLPPELVPPSARDLDSSVDMLKDLLKHESRSRSPSTLDVPVSRLKSRSFNSSSSSLESGRDATIYKHNDSEPPGGFYQPRSRHINRDDVRSRNEEGPSADLTQMKRQLANAAGMLDRATEAEAAKTAEDEELEREMDDVKYRVKRVSDDLEYLSRGPRSAAKDEEKRRLERELMSLMHERVPDLERKIKARDERREREKRQWVRDRDRANERFGRYDSKDDTYSSRRYDYDRTPSRRDRSRSREGERERPRSPPRPVPSPPPTPLSAPVSASRESPVPSPKATPSPAPRKNMSPEERQAYARAEAKRRIEARMAALGVTAPSSTPSLDTSVEDRLQQEKKEAEEKARVAEKQAEERERLRRERLENEKASKEAKTPATLSATSTLSPTATTPATANSTRTASAPVPTPRAAPPPQKPKAPAPPPPRRLPTVNTTLTPPAPPTPVKQPVAETKPVLPSSPGVHKSDPEEEALRMREEALKKQREARVERLRQLEKEEEEAAKREEEQYQARLQALKAKSVATQGPPVTSNPHPEPPPTAAVSSSAAIISPPPRVPSITEPPSIPTATPTPSSIAEKSTNPFSRFIQNKDKDTDGAVSSPMSTSNGSTNPWAKTMNIPAAPSPPKSPLPSPSKPSYNTAPASISDDDDWDEIKENEGDDDSSDDDIAKSRATRTNIAEQLFGSMLPRPASGAAVSAPTSSPASPMPTNSAAPPPPPPAPAAPIPPPPPVVQPAASTTATTPTGAGDVNALMQSIQGGMKLRPTKTVDKSGPPVSGRVLGDAAPPAYINTISGPQTTVQTLPEPDLMVTQEHSKSDNRQSVDWFANRAVDAGVSTFSTVDKLPATVEEEEQEEKTFIPAIQIEESAPETTSNPLSDIDTSIEYRVRTLYSFEGDGPEDLSFGENVVLTAHPSKSGSDWWQGTLLNTQKSGLFPKTFVEVFQPVSAKALFSYQGNNPDELSFTEGDVLSIVDRSEEVWWKAEYNGTVFIVPATYLEVVEDLTKQTATDSHASNTSLVGLLVQPITASQGLRHAEIINGNILSDVDDDDGCSDSASDYLSFESDGGVDVADAKAEHEARERERERQKVLEAAGLIVTQDVRPPPELVRTRSKNTKHRPAPAVPHRCSVRQNNSYTKDLPPVPDLELMDHATRLEDAFDRFESFRNQQLSNNRLSVISTDSVNLAPPTTSTLGTNPLARTTSRENEGQGKYSHFLHFFKTPEIEKRSSSTLTISAPISGIPQDASRSGSPGFGTSWASLVEASALEEMPPNERKRQEAIFELIITEATYVRDLQLIVEVFYASMMPMLSDKEVTVIFANIEDVLLVNTAFLSSLEERQKDCRLYIDKIGDVLCSHIPNMGVYMQYCVNQATAIKVLQSLREENHELASHLQRLRDGNAVVRNLDLSSYLLAPMQRITKYPLLIKQIQHYTEAEEEQADIAKSLYTAESLLDRINETIRDQEGREKLRLVSRNLWIGSGRLDLTAPTRHMGPRKLLREGLLVKAKSGRKLHGFLCSDILVLTDASVKTLYRLPIPLAYSQAVLISTSKDELTLQIKQAYPRGGDKILLKVTPIRDGHGWIEDFNNASRRCRKAEERAARQYQG
ncbi:hypothetical protein AX17_001904 [Amanita inopinata Kibby_2008]|nr:hypothetical protein AX17_001904 [Amanita inopinata Kibby_2008]